MAGKSKNMESTNPREDNRNDELEDSPAPDPEDDETTAEDDPQAD
jgi:hypothetical protein